MSPFVVAHRAGNGIDALRRAESVGVGLVEADVRLYRGRLEVRHLKTVGPLPILWDRWMLAAPWRPRLTLRELLSATSDRTELLLDLKGPRRALGERVLDELRPYLGRRTFTVCSRWWRLLEPFEGTSVRRIHSVGSRRQLDRLLARFAGHRLDGVSVHERLLDERVVAELKELAGVVMTWPVNGRERASELVRLGVDGLITDEAERISSVTVAAGRA